MSKIITIRRSDGEEINCNRIDYLKAKMKDLIEFGYNDLTLEHVGSQLNKIYGKKELDIIGELMKGDIVIDE